MKNRQNNSRQGFIALFFILGISFTFLTWISLSSERVFAYVDIKKAFVEHRKSLQDTILCADAFINIVVQSKNSLSFAGQEYQFKRGLYFDDGYSCHVKSIQTVFTGNSLDKVFFIIGDFRFGYQFKNGFVDHITSFNLF